MKKFSIALVIMLLFTTTAQARELSLEDAVAYAIERNEDMKIAEFSVEKMDYLIKEVRTVLYPTLNANASYMLFHAKKTPYEEFPVTAQTPYMAIFNGMNNYSTHGFKGSATVEAHQLVYAFGMVGLALDTAKLSKELMTVQKDLAITNLRFSIKNAYFATLVYEENYKIAQQSYNNALNTKRRLSSSASVRMSQADLIKVDADIASRKPIVDNAKLLLAQGHRLLQTLCVLDEPITSLTTSFNDMPKTDVELASLLARIPDSPAIQALEMAIDLDYKSAESKKGAKRPSISIVGSYTIGQSSDSPLLTEGTFTGEGAIGLYAQIPLFDAGKAKNQSRQAELDARINTSKKEQTQRQLETALVNAYETYHSKMEVLKADNAAITLAERSYQMSLSRFLNGQTSATELNNVEQGLTMLKMSRMGTLNAIYASLAQIQQIIGDI